MEETSLAKLRVLKPDGDDDAAWRSLRRTSVGRLSTMRRRRGNVRGILNREKTPGMEMEARTAWASEPLEKVRAQGVESVARSKGDGEMVVVNCGWV